MFNDKVCFYKTFSFLKYFFANVVGFFNNYYFLNLNTSI